MKNNSILEQMFVLASHPNRGLEFICVEVPLEMGVMQFQDKCRDAVDQASAKGYVAIAAFALDDPAGKQLLGKSSIPGLTKQESEAAIDQEKAMSSLLQKGVSPDLCHIQMLQSETLIEASNNLKRSDSEQKIANYETQHKSPR